MKVEILVGDCRDMLARLPDESVHTVVTSPPYFGLRDYGVDGQIGLEPSPAEFVETMVDVFREVRRVLRSDGTLWLNLGDSYAGSWGAQGKRETPGEISRNSVRNHPKRARQTSTIREEGLKPKDLIGIPWRVAFALQAEGWWLRQDIVWSKPNPMPESVRDRCTKAHEYLFLMSKSERYYFDQEAILEPVSPNTNARVSQAVMEQVGSARAHGGNDHREQMKAVVRRPKVAAAGSGIKYNDSFDAAVCMPVDKRNKRTVWTVATEGFSEAHFATFPPALVVDCIKAGCPAGGTVLDPFFGAGTTGLVANREQRNCIGIELNPAYAAMAERRIRADGGMLTEISVREAV